MKWGVGNVRRGVSGPFRSGVFLPIVVLVMVLALWTAASCQAQSSTTSAGESGAVVPPPLTGAERWHFYANETFLSSGIYFAAFGSALGLQSSGKPRAWGGGFEGYGRRSASQYGLFAIQNTVHDTAAAAFGHEPRYFRCQCTGAWRRTGRALEMTFLTYDAHGHKRLDLPQLAGAYSSGMISTLWYPKGYSPLVQGVQAGHTQFAFVAGIHLIQEFSPEIRRSWPFRTAFKSRAN